MILASELPGAKIIFFYEFLENIRILCWNDRTIDILDIEERTQDQAEWLTKDEVDIVYILSLILLHHSYNIHNLGHKFSYNYKT